jgi:TetR/AcrR family transcriptional regulator, regulator of cefoperazone and chloramphenicol sensitivity
MGRDGSRTRERLLDAAQHLFARRGVDSVPIREINLLAGQRNPSALHYHFGTRKALVVAIAQRHQPAIDHERAELLGAAGDDPEAMLGAVLVPLAARLGSPEGRDYLRLVPQLIGPGYDERGLPSPPALVEGLNRLGRQLDGLTDAVRSERLRSMLLTTTTLLADRAARLESDLDPPLEHEAFIDELITMATGLLLARPVAAHR